MKALFFGRWLLVVAATTCSFPSAVHACTGTIRPAWNSWNHIKVNLSGFPPELQAQVQSALDMAIAQWNSNCTEGTIPRLSTQVPEGSAYFVEFTFEYVAGGFPNQAIQRVCGQMVSAALSRVFAFQWDGGQLKPCPTADLAKLTHVLAHEIGHRLGLSDTDCTDHIMSKIPAGTDNSEVKPAECTAANSLNSTAAERGLCDQPNDCRVSPILLSCQRDPWQLTSVASGVSFDYDGDGTETQTAWTQRRSRLGFLFTDLDGSGCAERGAELFGENRQIGEGSLAENGYEALDGYDSNRDGWITEADADWGLLRLWVDHSHDGLCSADEVASLADAQVLAIELEYQTSSFVDAHGNAFRYYSDALCRQSHGPPTRRTVWDVFFATAGSD